MRFVGIDIGKAKCRAAIMDPGGIILEEFTFTKGSTHTTTKPTMNGRFKAGSRFDNTTRSST